MGYRFPVSTVTQRRLAQVINDRKKDEENKYRPFGPDIPDTSIPFSDTLGGEGMPGLRVEQIRERPNIEQRRQAGREVTSRGQPRLTDVQKAEGIAAGTAYETRADDPAIDMQRLKIVDPIKYKEISDLVSDSTKSSQDRYGVRTLIQQGNIAGADPSHLTKGAYQTPSDKVPLDGQHSKMVVVTPQESNDDIYINELAKNLPQGTLIRVEGESQFGTLSAGESFAGLGKVLLGFVDVASVPFEAFAETAFQLTHTAPWKTTLWEGGFNATVEKHRSRGLIAQLAVGVVFDPFVIGKALKIPVGITRAAARRFIRQTLVDIPELSNADKARIAQEIEDKVVGASGRTFDSDKELWWSPAQNKWIGIDAAGQAAHMKEFGVPLIAGGAPIPGERASSPFPGGTFWSGPSEAFPISPKLSADAQAAGFTNEQLRRQAGSNRRPTNQDLRALIDEQIERLGGAEEAELLDEALSGEAGERVLHVFDEAAAQEGQASTAARTAYTSQAAQVTRAREAFEKGEGFGMPVPYQTREVGAVIGPGFMTEGEFQALIDEPWSSWRIFGEDLGPPTKTVIDRLSGGETILEKALLDRNADIAKLTARSTNVTLEAINKHLIQRGGIPLHSLPDQWNAHMHFGLGSGAESASEAAYKMAQDDVQRALGNKLVDDAGNKITTDAVDKMAAFLHHIDAITMTNVDIAGTRLTKENLLDVDGIMRQGTGEKRSGPLGMSVYQLQQTIRAMRTQLGDTPDFASKKAAHQAAERQKWEVAAAQGESYTQIPFEKAPFERVMDGVEALVRHYGHIREMYVQSGIMSAEMSRQLETLFPFYNPVKYVKGEIKEHVDVFGSQSAKAVGINQTAYRELGAQGLDGTEAVLQRPMTAMISATREAYRNIYYNNMAVALINNEMQDTSLPAGLVRMVVKLNPGQKLRSFEIRHSDTPRSEFRGIPLKRVSRRINGEHEVWDIPRDHAEQLQAMTMVDYNLGMRILRMANRPFRMIFTSHNPVFMAANFLHDMMIVMMNEGVMPLALFESLSRNLMDIHGRDALMNTMRRYGGDVGGYTGRTMEEQAMETSKRAARLESGMSEFSTYEKWAKRLTSPVHFLNYLSRSIEMAPRRATFKTVLEREQARMRAGTGLSAAEEQRFWSDMPGGQTVRIEGKEYSAEAVRAAAYAARNVTVDFQKYGSAVKLFDAMFLYTNAAIQGTMLPIRALRRGGARLGAPPGVPTFSRAGGWKRRMAENRAKLSLLGFAGVAAAVYAWNRKNFPEAYQNMSLIDRITRLNVIYGEEEQEDGSKKPLSFSALPLLREYSSINAGIVMTLDKIFDLDSANGEQFLTALIPQVNPVGTVLSFGGRDSSFGLQPLPTVTAPGQIISETWRNWDSFRNAPIVDERMANRPPAEQYDEYTSESAKRIGGFFKASPKRVEHLIGVGALQDFWMGIDHLIQLGNENKTPRDLALDSAAAELEQHLENFLPADRPRVRNEFYNQVLLEIPREDGSIKREPLSSDDRHKIRLLLREEDTGIPIITSLKDRFWRQSGGQLRRTGMVRASKEFGTDPTETAEMAIELGLHLSQQVDAQEKLDAAYRDGRLSAKQWREADRESGIGYQAILVSSMSKHPDAAQALKTPEGLRNPAAWQDYLTVVRTGLGSWDDARTEGQMFAAAHRGVEMPLDYDGQPDYATYFKHIQELRDAINADHGERGIKALDAELMSVMTPLQREYYNEVGLGAQGGGLRAYWDIATQIAMREPGLAGHVYRLFLNANDDARMTLKVQYKDEISGVQRKVNAAREAFRQQNPTMDYLYVKWGYAEAAQTPYGEFGVQQRLGRGAQSLGWMTAQNPNQPAPQGEVVLR